MSSLAFEVSPNVDFLSEMIAEENSGNSEKYLNPPTKSKHLNIQVYINILR
jgi:hypothetical protein